MRYAMVIDTRKCVGCMDCVLACQNENHVPEGYCRDWIVTETVGKFPNLRLEIRSERCNHCDRPPCAVNCPTGAIHIDEGGIVLVSNERCTGCKNCMVACPYQVGFINPKTNCSDKCTFCVHRVREGLKPACVSVCPTKCMHFGDLHDPDSEVSLLLKNRKWKVLKPDAGTGPNVYYLI